MRNALVAGGILLGALVPSAVSAQASEPARLAPMAAEVRALAALPTAAVALGDSFISGEGAGAYQPVVDVNGVAQGFPGWAAPNSNAFFCHRSANASLQVAPLQGIDARFNLACSGGQPADLATPSNNRVKGRTVSAQLDQLRAVAQSHDIDVVLVGLGSNNSSFTFGDAAAECAGRFVADGYIGWWEFWVPIINWITGATSPESPCTANDLATPQELVAAQAETTAALRALVQVLDEVDADGQHRIVLQDYTNPLPPDFNVKFHTEDGRSDTRDKFRDLVRERYAAGCPAHRASLGPAHQFSQGLGNLVRGAHATLRAEFPTKDLVYLNVQRAFDGARLCETTASPTGALATPVRLMDQAGGIPTGVHLTNINGTDKIDIARIQGVCTSWFQTCQESWHPNAQGHAVLGQCLAAAVSAVNDERIDCVRNPSTGVISAS
jgi:lysophospholipase L1-like esterase